MKEIATIDTNGVHTLSGLAIGAPLIIVPEQNPANGSRNISVTTVASDETIPKHKSVLKIGNYVGSYQDNSLILIPTKSSIQLNIERSIYTLHIYQ